MRQFDVFVWGFDTKQDSNSASIEWEAPFTDSALAWFPTNDFNGKLNESEAEWIVFAHRSMLIDRKFLNDLAESIGAYPMVDAFAPRIHDLATRRFLSGYTLDKKFGFSMIDENAKMRYVAAPHPLISAFSRRIVQRIGRFDDFLSHEAQFADFALRMLHADGKMFSVPYLVCNSDNVSTNDSAERPAISNRSEQAYVLYKAFGFWQNTPFLVRNAGTIHHLWANRKSLSEKREKAILLSKLKKDFLAELY